MQGPRVKASGFGLADVDSTISRAVHRALREPPAAVFVWSDRDHPRPRADCGGDGRGVVRARGHPAQDHPAVIPIRPASGSCLVGQDVPVQHALVSCILVRMGRTEDARENDSD